MGQLLSTPAAANLDPTLNNGKNSPLLANCCCPRSKRDVTLLGPHHGLKIRKLPLSDAPDGHMEDKSGSNPGAKFSPAASFLNLQSNNRSTRKETGNPRLVAAVLKTHKKSRKGKLRDEVRKSTRRKWEGDHWAGPTERDPGLDQLLGTKKRTSFDPERFSERHGPEATPRREKRRKRELNTREGPEHFLEENQAYRYLPSEGLRASSDIFELLPEDIPMDRQTSEEPEELHDFHHSRKRHRPRASSSRSDTDYSSGVSRSASRNLRSNESSREVLAGPNKTCRMCKSKAARSTVCYSQPASPMPSGRDEVENLAGPGTKADKNAPVCDGEDCDCPTCLLYPNRLQTQLACPDISCGEGPVGVIDSLTTCCFDDLSGEKEACDDEYNLHKDECHEELEAKQNRMDTSDILAEDAETSDSEADVNQAAMRTGFKAARHVHFDVHQCPHHGTYYHHLQQQHQQPCPVHARRQETSFGESIMKEFASIDERIALEEARGFLCREMLFNDGSDD